MPATTLVLFAVCMAGCAAMTAVAYYYPDSPAYITYGLVVITIALLVLAAFLMER
jgi:hypothetical protein